MPITLFFLFFVIHYTSIRCNTRALNDISILPSKSPQRPCRPYESCRPNENCRLTSKSSDPSILGYGEQATNNLTSAGGRFQVGFFHRGSNTYLGIWYNFSLPSPNQVIVWVANRNNPMPLQRQGISYYLTIADDGNAKVHSTSNNISYWSTNSTTMSSTASSIILQLSDTGNLILLDRGGRGGMLWQSFDHPTDTFLPGMDITLTGFKLVSWNSPENPAQGNYLFQQGDGDASKTLFMYNSSQSSNVPYWDSAYSSLHPYLTPLLSKNMTGDSSSTIRLVMNATGSVQLWENWSMIWEAPNNRCDLFNACGSFGVCDAGNRFRCKCLPGYKPNDQVKWESEDFSSGCSKRTNDQCGKTFLSLPMINLPIDPDFNSESRNGTDCRDLCLSSCGCKAYFFNTSKSKCLIWTNELTHIQQEYYSPSARTIHIRLNNLDIDSGSRTCTICGSNVIPYPLSTNKSCGDPTYFSFHCNSTNGQVYFKPPGGQVYKVSLINPNSRTFFVQLATTSTLGTCSIANIKSNMFNLNNSSPFSVLKCSVTPLTDKKVVDVELSWKPPSPPACNSSPDCKDWPQTTCVENTDGKRLCFCPKDFNWDSVNMNCTKAHHKHIPSSLKAGIATASGVAILLFGSSLLLLHCRRKRAIQKRAGNANQFKTDDMEDIDIPCFDYQSILAATDNFSEANKLGAGGFGPVYKVLLYS